MWCCRKCEIYGKTVMEKLNHLILELEKTKEALKNEEAERKALKVEVEKLNGRIKTTEENACTVDVEKIEKTSKTFAEAALKKYTEEFPALQEESVNRLIVQKVEEIRETAVPTVNIEEKVEEAEQRMREDQREIESRKKNCIIHNLKEAETQDKDERKTHDISAVESFMEKCGVEDIAPVYYLRLGQKNETTNARPLKIVFESEEAKLTLVKRYCYTKHNGSPAEQDSIEGISIVPDRTKKEREEYKKLKDTLDERVRKGEKNFMIRN